MRSLITGFLVLISFFSFALLSTSAWATTRTVSGEVKLKPKTDNTEKYLAMKKAILAEITTLTADIASFEASIFDIQEKITARLKAGIKDNADLRAKLKALKKAKIQTIKDLKEQKKKLAYIESKLK